MLKSVRQTHILSTCRDYTKKCHRRHNENFKYFIKNSHLILPAIPSKISKIHKIYRIYKREIYKEVCKKEVYKCIYM